MQSVNERSQRPCWQSMRLAHAEAICLRLCHAGCRSPVSVSLPHPPCASAVAAGQQAVKITAKGEAFGHHGDCDGAWNQCGDAATCALWACQAKGYTTLVGYGASAACNYFQACKLLNQPGDCVPDGGWGNGVFAGGEVWCPLLAVTDIYCSSSGGSCAVGV
jgi:hypothetical protein